MKFRTRGFFTVLFLMAVVGGCGRKADTAAAVATPTLTVSRPNAPVGSPIDMGYRFVVAQNAPVFGEDYWVFVHFLDTDGELMWTDDHQPPVPTSQWKPGATIEYSRTMFVPKFPYSGETRVELGLYSPKTGTRLPLQGETTGQRSYHVASFNLLLQSDNLFIVFKDGWHDTEVAGEGLGLEWQWSKKTGTLAFRNPMRDAVFYLQADQPVTALGEPQHVEIRLGQTVIDSFTLPPGPRELRRVNITKDQFGSSETVEMSILVDKTFIPAALPQMKSTDSRELGIRVFKAFVGTK